MLDDVKDIRRMECTKVVGCLFKTVTLVSYFLFTPIVFADQNSISLHKALPKPANQSDLEALLTGKWVLSKWRTRGPVQDYKIAEPSVTFYRIYHAGDFFYVSFSKDTGKAYHAYGGRYEVIGNNRLRETVEYRFNYDEVFPAYGVNGEMALRSGKSMVGAVFDLEVKIDNDEMYHIGRIIQNRSAVEDATSFRDVVIDDVYRKVKQKDVD